MQRVHYQRSRVRERAAFVVTPHAVERFYERYGHSLPAEATLADVERRLQQLALASQPLGESRLGGVIAVAELEDAAASETVYLLLRPDRDGRNGTCVVTVLAPNQARFSLAGADAEQAA
jgi:hypothetical protein